VTNPNPKINQQMEVLSISTFATQLRAISQVAWRLLRNLNPAHIVAILTGMSSDNGHKLVVQYIPDEEKPDRAEAMEPRKGYVAPINWIYRDGKSGMLFVRAIGELLNDISIQGLLLALTNSMNGTRRDSLVLGVREPTKSGSQGYKTFLVDGRTLESFQFTAKAVTGLDSATLANGYVFKPTKQPGAYEFAPISELYANPNGCAWKTATIPSLNACIASLTRDEQAPNSIVVNMVERGSITINAGDPTRPNVTGKTTTKVDGPVVTRNARFAVVQQQSQPGAFALHEPTLFAPATSAN
jgi:hypothetical protein